MEYSYMKKGGKKVRIPVSRMEKGIESLKE